MTEPAIDIRESARSQLGELGLFAGVDEASLALIEENLETIALPSGTVLFEQGEESDSLYIIRSGRLHIYIEDGQGGERSIAQIGAGETVGELGVLTGEPRSASVRTVRDTELIKLGRPLFHKLLDDHPSSIVTLTRAIARRLHHHVEGRMPHSTMHTVCLMPLSRNLPLEWIKEAMLAGLNQMGPTTTLTKDRAAGETSDWFAYQERSCARLVYHAQPKCNAWTRLCLRQSDLVLLIARADDPEPPGDLLTMIENLAVGRVLKLVVLQPKGTTYPVESAPWLNRISARLRFNLVPETPGAAARIGRIVTGRAVGVVLSGGGARGFAHIGVIRALNEMGIEIDHVAGVSMGSIMAGGVAMGWSLDEFRQRLQETFIDINPVGDYTLPMHAFTRGKRLTRLIRENFGDRAIEDLWLPYFCTSTNLTEGGPTCFRQGPLWRAIRASVSIPGLVPPVVHDGQVFVDGGLVNNMPVDVMDEINLGPVIGVDSGGVRGNYRLDERVFNAGPVDTFRSWRTPAITSVLVRSAMVAGESHTSRLAKMADVVLTPALHGIGLLNWRAIDRMIEIGYECASAPKAVEAVKAAVERYEVAQVQSKLTRSHVHA
ncbi:MAG: patatin-like phospholipase family protein [Geminicoccaceae bacterium]